MSDKKKMGRPIKGKYPRNKRISLKLAENEMDMLEYCSKKLEEPRVNVIAKGIKKIYLELEKNN